MKTIVTSCLLSVLLLSGCSQGPSLTLKDIQPKRVFHLTRPEVFEVVRLFGLKEGFRIDSMEEETGRVIGHCTLQASAGAAASKVIIMNLRVFPVDSERSEVNARFTFSSLGDALTREEENILVDHYQNLFGVLERNAQ